MCCCSVRHHDRHPAAGRAEELPRRRRHARRAAAVRRLLGVWVPDRYWRQREQWDCCRFPSLLGGSCMSFVVQGFNAMCCAVSLVQVMLTVATSDLFTGPTRYGMRCCRSCATSSIDLPFAPAGKRLLIQQPRETGLLCATQAALPTAARRHRRSRQFPLLATRQVPVVFSL